MKAMKDFT